MRTYALVPIEALLHETDSMEHVKQMQQEAALGGATLILVKPMETIINHSKGERAAPDRNKAPWSQIMSALDDLKAAVTKNGSVIESAITLINGFKDKAAASSDPDMVALAADLGDETERLAAAVAANTVAKDEPAPAPTEEPAA